MMDVDRQSLFACDNEKYWGNSSTLNMYFQIMAVPPRVKEGEKYWRPITADKQDISRGCSIMVYHLATGKTCMEGVIRAHTTSFDSDDLALFIEITKGDALENFSKWLEKRRKSSMVWVLNIVGALSAGYVLYKTFEGKDDVLCKVGPNQMHLCVGRSQSQMH